MWFILGSTLKVIDSRLKGLLCEFNNFSVSEFKSKGSKNVRSLIKKNLQRQKRTFSQKLKVPSRSQPCECMSTFAGRRKGKQNDNHS